MLDDTLTGVVRYLRSALERIDGPIEEIRTHASIVLLGVRMVWKLKRAVKFGYLDFSTAEKRLSACLREYEMNRLAAPDLYLGVRRITANDDGYEFDGSGVLVDAIVEMRRFPADALYETLAADRKLTPALIGELADKIWKNHSQAAVPADKRGAARIAHVLEINETAFIDTGLSSDKNVQLLIEALRREFNKCRHVLDCRADDGKVRRCHGDLTLRNICIFEGSTTLFDCLEFDDELATIDVLYDLAFPLMDLWRLDLKTEANNLFNRYFDYSGDAPDMLLLPFLMALRAAVRSHVTAARAPGQRDGAEWKEALSFAELALQLLELKPCELVAIGGFSGSGKSTLTANIAAFIGRAPGARHLSTDRMRKSYFGVAPTTRLPSNAYYPDISRIIYAKLKESAQKILTAGSSVVTDAVYDRQEDRAEIQSLAEQMQIDFHGLWLDAPRSTQVERINSRHFDPSDATPEILDLQRSRGTGAMRWNVIDAGQAPENVAGTALKVLSSQRHIELEQGNRAEQS